MDAPTPQLDVAQLESLCGKAAGGDGEALERLLLGHHDRLLSYARRKIGLDWQGKIDCEDVLQEAYVEIFNTVSSFVYKGPDSFYHWSSQIVDHRFIDRVRHFRRKKRDAGREVAAANGTHMAHMSLLERCMQETQTPIDFARKQDAVAAMMACVATLPEDYRTVVQRIYLNQDALAAVATDMGRSEDAVRRLGGRALERLAECMGRASRFLSSG